ncbi:MAG: PQQ-binding-like beta-propeller repeat protein [Methanococcaceae archaeon]
MNKYHMTVPQVRCNFKSKITCLFLLLLFTISPNLWSQAKGEWPCYHGLDRQNKSGETGLINTWPSAGPELLWTISGLGEGYSSVSVGGGLIYTAGLIGNQSYLFAYNLKGQPVWKKPNGDAWSVKVSWASSYNGPRSTPAYDNGIVYHLSENGRLTAFRSKDGSVVWTRDLPKEFDAEMPMYGYAESVLIDGENLFVRPGGLKGYQACLNKNTGKTIWTNADIPGGYGYNSMVMMNFGGFRQIIGASNTIYYSLDVKTGRLLWKADFRNQYEINCTDAIIFQDKVFLTSGEGKGCSVIRLKKTATGITPEKVWETEDMDNYHGGVILHNGYLYGAGNLSRGWYCIDFLTGKQMWKSPGGGSLTYADGMIYLYDEKGSMKLVKATPDKFEKTGEFKVPKGGPGPFWAHPVVCGGKLYIRHADKIFAYDVTKK